jgi:hypothetical protein
VERILVLCETPYQIIVVSKTISTFYKDAVVDIIVTDHINGGEKLVERLKKSKLFNDAFYLEIKNLNINSVLNPVTNYFNKFLKVRSVLKQVANDKKYSKFMFCNIDIVVQHIIWYLKKYSHVDVFMFEDGLSSYRRQFGDFFKKFHEKINVLDKLRLKVLRSNFAKIKGFYLFNPKYLEWKSNFPVFEIPKIDREDKILIEELNQIFMYDDIKDEYNYKYIFFEESYFADGYRVNDIELVNKISDIVGKDNILVKIHPRSPINRFKELGYNTNQITSTPWEIIALNMKLEDKVLITIASGSVMNPFIIMGINLKAIMLFNYENLNTELLPGLIEIIESICRKNPQCYSLPINYEELEHSLLKK